MRRYVKNLEQGTVTSWSEKLQEFIDSDGNAKSFVECDEKGNILVVDTPVVVAPPKPVEVKEKEPVSTQFANKEELLVEAIKRLEVGNKDHWTKTGEPRIEALELELGFDVSMAERDEAWVEYAKIQTKK